MVKLEAPSRSAAGGPSEVQPQNQVGCLVYIVVGVWIHGVYTKYPISADRVTIPVPVKEWITMCSGIALLSLKLR